MLVWIIICGCCLYNVWRRVSVGVLGGGVADGNGDQTNNQKQPQTNNIILWRLKVFISYFKE